MPTPVEPQSKALGILKKLLKFQKLNIKVAKVGENTYHQAKYATLNEVLEKVKKPLNDMEILIVQSPEKEGLRTALIDLEDSSTVECFMPYTQETTTAQKLGSNNTYNRRYSLVTLLGLEDEDDDGNHASVQDAPRRATKVETPPRPTSSPKSHTEAPSASGEVLNPVCDHDLPAKRVMSKSAKNPNRWFYACPKPKAEQCKYFEWEDELQQESKFSESLKHVDLSEEETHDVGNDDLGEEEETPGMPF